MRYSGATHSKSYTLAHPIIRFYEKLAYDLTVVGEEDFPMTGPVVVGASHRDANDSLSVNAAICRPVNVGTKEEMWTEEYGITLPHTEKLISLGHVATYFDGFPINRANPQLSTYRHMGHLLTDNKVVELFAEGTRYDDEERKVPRGQKLGKLFDGVGRLSIRYGAPLVPIAVATNKEKRARGRLRLGKCAVVINKPIKQEYEGELPRIVPKHLLRELMEEFRISLQSGHDQATELVS